MSVGTQSIRRAATKAAETASEKTTAKKDSGVRAGVIPSVSPEVAETMLLTGREHFQINDELPVYLL